ncbi:unnamed protein product [Chironomus riparius]|uniref:Receptor protein-tyrosine kinase n=1 Tax=Chironomus riparius TaxID=315576 RepID=A0A9P0NGU1_9DIPT|nr:unnamed protein product [Chironomus riparius]
MDRIQLDGECLRKDECPIYEKHFLIDEQCTFCHNCSKSCSIKLNNINDLKNISECNLAETFQIENLEDSFDEDIKELLTDKFQTIAEIESCLIIRNSSGITNFNFLKMLRRISGNIEDPDCFINEIPYSVIIEDNDNLQEGFRYDFEVIVRNGVYIRNNRNLCQTDVRTLAKTFKSFNFDSFNRLQTEDCNHPKINIQTFSKDDSILLLTDLIKSKNKIQIRFWEDDIEEVTELSESFYEIDNLESNKTYPFKIDIVDEDDQINYSTNYQFFQTSKFDEIITNWESTSTSDSITITWESATSFSNFHAQNKFGNFFYITYKSLNTKFCDDTAFEEVLENELQVESTRKFGNYFFNNPINENADFKTLDHKIVDGTKNFINITDLENSTCYRFDIYPCRQTNILMCNAQVIHLEATLTPTTQEESKSPSNFIGFSIFGVSIIVLIIFLFYKFGLRPIKNSETHIELVNQGGVIDVDQWELEREHIVQIKVLGSGEFGVVYKGYIRPNEEKFYAIKTLAPFKEAFEDNFKKEAQIMRRFNAPHVVKLIGYCTKERPLLVVMEYMMHGDLKKFLQRNRPIEIHDKSDVPTQKGSYTTVAKAVLHPIRPVHQMAIEIADGMLYLEDIKFIHCDLACRNLMVNENYTIKIGDFGMARELYHTDYYKPGSRNKKIPLRWMAPEALGTDEILPRYTSKSDVFSYGIVLFELVTFCDTPYAGCLDEEVIVFIKAGRILDQPKDCNDNIYELMKRCWRFDPNERIDFREVIKYLLDNFDIPNFSNSSYYHTHELGNE